MRWRGYDEARAAAFDAERAGPDAHVAEVRDVVVAELAAVPGALLMDLGAGTGLWSDRLSRWTARRVVAAEPSHAMVAVLARKNLPGVCCVQARGEALPVRDDACGAAWLSTVVHHFDDLGAAARETSRVLAPGGVAVVRSSFPDQPSGKVLSTAFFPSAARAAGDFPTLDMVVSAFRRAGLGLVRRHAPREVASDSRLGFLQRVRGRADSLLRQVPEEEFRAGLRALREWAEAAPSAPVHFQPDLLVFR